MLDGAPQKIGKVRARTIDVVLDWLTGNMQVLGINMRIVALIAV